MKLLGTMLLLGSGLWVSRGIITCHRAIIAAGEELLEALQLLEQGVYLLRQPLPELIIRCGQIAQYTQPMWETVTLQMRTEIPFAAAWRAGTATLCEPYRHLLTPLGRTLPAGTARELIQQVKEDVYRAVEQARRECGQRGRLATALCLSASFLTVVVLL